MTPQEIDHIAESGRMVERASDTAQNVSDSDLVSRKAAIEVIDAVFPVDPMKSEYAQGIACGAALAKTYVEQLPSAQPERKKGKWILHLGFSSPWECSECNTFQRDVSWYCPHCGVQMEVRG